MQYKPYTLNNFKSLPQIKALSDEQLKSIEIVGSVLPFKTNNYITDYLINWSNVPDDPMFVATFPQKEMLLPEDYATIESLYDAGADEITIQQAANEIRLRLNPHPAGQLEYNTPVMDDEKLTGLQHKYRQTVLFFPNQGQKCHAYCTFCFRWPQFTGLQELKMASPQSDNLIKYLAAHPEVSDVLITGGDPMVMSAKVLSSYIDPLLGSDLPNLRTIRIGTRALSFWPFRFLTDSDCEELLALFKKITDSGLHLAFMAQFNHPVELSNNKVKEAITRIQQAGAVIRTQSPLLRHINDSWQTWADLWKRQVALNCIPYYMFIARNTGAHHYFSVPLVEAWQIFKQAYQSVSGICRTVRGPSMSSLPGKVQIVAISEICGEKTIILQMLQGRNPDWVRRPFFASYDENATWLDELKPAFGQEKFFFSDELNSLLEPGEVDTDFE